LPRLRLRLEYHGAHFQGWQIQPRGVTVQGALEGALLELTGTSVRVIGAGRTDAGVHARGQVAHCDVPEGGPRESWQKALNAVLPAGVAVLEAALTSGDFHARHDACSKAYRYRILNRRAPSPLRAELTWHVRKRLDLDAMRSAAADLLGNHDFSAFRGAPGGAPSRERTERTLDRLEWVGEGDELHLWAEGQSFMRYMVRNLAGTLVEIGLGKRPASEATRILASKDRSRAGRTAPAHGLCLEAVRYPARREGAREGAADSGAREATVAGKSSLDPQKSFG